jgi:hypothetical protein
VLQASSWRIGSRLRGGGGQEDGVGRRQDDSPFARRARMGRGRKEADGRTLRTPGVPPRRTRGEVFRVDLRYRLFGLCFK